MTAIMMDVGGVALSQQERAWIADPRVGGVLLFARNYQSLTQLCDLTAAIRAASPSPVLIAVDQEGGRVQRFRAPFTHLPPLHQIGLCYEQDREQALALAFAHAYVMASECLACGIDISFAPILDVFSKESPVIANRAFHHQIDVIKACARSYCQGMHAAGMATTGKHFPGHGQVTVDSHLGLPLDPRDLKTLQQDDLACFTDMGDYCDAMMTAHIHFPQVDDSIVTFSSYWLKTVLRETLGFSGVIFSDDLSMGGAQQVVASYRQRFSQARQAGCDMALVCNNHQALVDILEDDTLGDGEAATRVISTMAARRRIENWEYLQNDATYQSKHALFAQIPAQIRD